MQQPKVQMFQLAHDRAVGTIGYLSAFIPVGNPHADLAAALHLDVILVIANRLGCINSTLLSIDYATRRSLRVAGYILNDTEPVSSAACRTNAASLKHLTEVPALGTVRYKEPLPLEIVKNVLRSFPPL